MSDVPFLSPEQAFISSLEMNTTDALFCRKLTTGDECLTSNSAEDDPARIAKRAILAAAKSRNAGAADLPADHDGRRIKIGDLPMVAYMDRSAPWAFRKLPSGEVRFELRAGDRSGERDTSKKKHRSELSAKGAKLLFDTDYWFAFDMMIEKGPPYVSRFCNLFQLHSTPDKGEFSRMSPVFAARYDGGDWIVYTRSYSTNPAVANEPTTTERYRDTPERGVYYRMVFRIRLSLTNGRIQIWRKKATAAGPLAEVANIAGVPIGYADAAGPYPQFGIYSGFSRQNIAVRYANLVWPQTGSLHRRVSKPPRLP